MAAFKDISDEELLEHARTCYRLGISEKSEMGAMVAAEMKARGWLEPKKPTPIRVTVTLLPKKE